MRLVFLLSQETFPSPPHEYRWPLQQSLRGGEGAQRAGEGCFGYRQPRNDPQFPLYRDDGQEMLVITLRNQAMTQPQPRSVDLARNLRQQCVPAEARLWAVLRERRLGGYKFRRQHPVAGYVADFACVECALIVEVDGQSHLENSAKDEKRSQVLENDGWKVLRFWNTQIYEELEAVKEAIYQECQARKRKS
jgi:very-short-patch-repair endonuclease